MKMAQVVLKWFLRSEKNRRLKEGFEDNAVGEWAPTRSPVAHPFRFG